MHFTSRDKINTTKLRLLQKAMINGIAKFHQEIIDLLKLTAEAKEKKNSLPTLIKRTKQLIINMKNQFRDTAILGISCSDLIDGYVQPIIDCLELHTNLENKPFFVITIRIVSILIHMFDFQTDNLEAKLTVLLNLFQQNIDDFLTTPINQSSIEFFIAISGHLYLLNCIIEKANQSRLSVFSYSNISLLEQLMKAYDQQLKKLQQHISWLSYTKLCADMNGLLCAIPTQLMTTFLSKKQSEVISHLFNTYSKSRQTLDLTNEFTIVDTMSILAAITTNYAYYPMLRPEWKNDLMSWFQEMIQKIVSFKGNQLVLYNRLQGYVERIVLELKFIGTAATPMYLVMERLLATIKSARREESKPVKPRGIHTQMSSTSNSGSSTNDCVTVIKSKTHKKIRKKKAIKKIALDARTAILGKSVPRQKKPIPGPEIKNNLKLTKDKAKESDQIIESISDEDKLQSLDFDDKTTPTRLEQPKIDKFPTDTILSISIFKQKPQPSKNKNELDSKLIQKNQPQELMDYIHALSMLQKQEIRLKQNELFIAELRKQIKNFLKKQNQLSQELLTWGENFIEFPFSELMTLTFEENKSPATTADRDDQTIIIDQEMQLLENQAVIARLSTQLKQVKQTVEAYQARLQAIKFERVKIFLAGYNLSLSEVNAIIRSAELTPDEARILLDELLHQYGDNPFRIDLLTGKPVLDQTLGNFQQVLNSGTLDTKAVTPTPKLTDYRLFKICAILPQKSEKTTAIIPPPIAMGR